MKNVWLVWYHDEMLRESHILKIYDTEYKAKAYIKRLLNNNIDRKREELYIEMREVK